MHRHGRVGLFDLGDHLVVIVDKGLDRVYDLVGVGAGGKGNGLRSPVKFICIDGIPLLIQHRLAVRVHLLLIAKLTLQGDRQPVEIHDIGTAGQLHLRAVNGGGKDSVLSLTDLLCSAEQLAPQALVAELDVSGDTGLLGGEGKLIGELGIADVDAGVFIAVDTADDGAQLRLLRELADLNAVDLQAIGGVAILVNAGLQALQAFLAQQILQCLVGVQIAGQLSSAKAHGLALIGGDGEGRPLLSSLKFQLNTPNGAIL